MSLVIYLLCIFIFCYFGSFREQKWAIFFRMLACICFVGMIGLRSPLVGVDSLTYYRHFYTYGNFGCHFVEQGFDLLTRILYHMGQEYTSLFFACALLTAIPIFLTLERCEHYLASSLMLYSLSLVMCVNGIRQVVVCGMFLYAIKYIENRNIIKYVFFIIIGYFFHASVLILLPLYFVLNMKYSNKVYILFYLLSFVFVLIPPSSIIEAILSHLNFGLRDYSKLHSDVGVETASTLGFVYASILRLLIFFLILKTQSVENKCVLTNLVFLSIVLPNLGYFIPLFSRITMYFTWFSYLLVPYLLAKYCQGFHNKYIQISLLFVFLYSIGFCNSILSKSNKMLPYTFCWEYDNHKKSIYN